MPNRSTRPIVGIDTGGTFTDLVIFEEGRLRQCKVLSTPDDPSRAIAEGLRRLGLGEDITIVHGTTVGTNAVLEGKGARVAYVTSEGFADVLTLGRQERERIYDLQQPPRQPPVPPEHCCQVRTRIDAEGGLLARAEDEEIEALAEKLEALDVEAVAINLLFSFLRPQEERRIAETLGDRWFLSCSSEVLPELREYERGIATWLNASIGPVIGRYLRRLRERVPGARISVMQSAGTTVAAAQAAGQAVRLLLSGPAGGIAAARMLGEVTGRPRMMTFDMGGTSTDVALLANEIPLTTESRIGRWPLTIPSVDIHTIGAGGGSIARVDEGGLLLVGPESAGADPGPACYGRGGEAVTVTDAHVVLGRIPGGTRLGGYLPLHAKAAWAAMDRLADSLGSSAMDAARGVIRIANEHMARALRVISVERGHDPQRHRLLCFGGAGGLHACELAELLDIETVVLPRRAGVLSAQGMLASEPGRDLSAAVLEGLSSIPEPRLESQFEALESEAATQLGEEGAELRRLRFRRRLELRYRGQSATLLLDYARGADHEAAFHAAHEAESGHRLDHEVELVNLRLSARAPAPMTVLGEVSESEPGQPGSTPCPELDRAVPVFDRNLLPHGETVAGPAIITDESSTAWLPPAWVAQQDRWGNVLMWRKDSGFEQR